MKTTPNVDPMVRRLADAAVSSDSHAASIHRLLYQNGNSLPVLGVSLEAGTDEGGPRLFLGYGRTTPREGIRPVPPATTGGSAGRFGLALPVSADTYGSAAFPTDALCEAELEALSEGGSIFSANYVRHLGMLLPRFMVHWDEAGKEAARAVGVVRGLSGARSAEHEREGSVRQHFIALGDRAVTSALDALETGLAAAGAEAADGLAVTLDTVADELALAR